MSPYGHFNLARQELKKIALKALYKLRKEMGKYFRENIKLTMKLFDALISPIPFYASEVWGLIAMNISEPRAIIESTPSHPPTGVEHPVASVEKSISFLFVHRYLLVGEVF